MPTNNKNYYNNNETINLVDNNNNNNKFENNENNNKDNNNKKLTKEEQLQLRSVNPGKSLSWYKSYERDFRKRRTIKLLEVTYDKNIDDYDVADAAGIGHWAINNWDKAVGFDKEKP